jgi:phosphoglucosamine mutase
MLEAAVAAGVMSAGADVLAVGVVTTPAVAYTVARSGAAGGIMISASHNPFEYNGIKVFGPDGFKVSDQDEDAIELLVRRDQDGLPAPEGTAVGRLRTATGACADYIDCLAASAPASVDGLKVVLDCAHGAASGIAPQVFARLGARVTTINAEPDGTNINVGCGSTAPETLARTVLQCGADLGLAFDGDADRLIAVDERGQVVDGDTILAVLALAMAGEGRLLGKTVVATVMSNLGLELALLRAGIKLLRTPVGDRFVLETMRRQELNLGGEQSGHIIFLDRAATGDGILTAVQLAGTMVRAGKRLSELAAVVERVPQVLVNVRVQHREGVEENDSIRAAIAQAEAELGNEGRVLVRASGTEPLVRVMVEATGAGRAERVAQALARVVCRELGR